MAAQSRGGEVLSPCDPLEKTGKTGAAHARSPESRCRAPGQAYSHSDSRRRGNPRQVVVGVMPRSSPTGCRRSWRNACGRSRRRNPAARARGGGGVAGKASNCANMVASRWARLTATDWRLAPGGDRRRRSGSGASRVDQVGLAHRGPHDGQMLRTVEDGDVALVTGSRRRRQPEGAQAWVLPAFELMAPGPQ
jgi:hypothetical protein